MMRVPVWCLVLSVLVALVVLAPSHVAASVSGWDTEADADAIDTGDIDSDNTDGGVPLDPLSGRPMLVRSHGRQLPWVIDVDADRLLPSEVASIQSAAGELRDALEAERKSTPTSLQRTTQRQSAELRHAGLFDPVTGKAYPFDSEGFPVVAFPRDALSTSVHRAMIADAMSEAKANGGKPNTNAGPVKPVLDQLSVTEEALVASLTNKLQPSALAPKLSLIQIGDRADEEKEEPTANVTDPAPTSEGPAFPTRTPNLIKLAGGSPPPCVAAPKPAPLPARVTLEAFVVPRHVVLVDPSIVRALELGDPRPTDDEIVEAAYQAQHPSARVLAEFQTKANTPTEAFAKRRANKANSKAARGALEA